MEPEPETEPRDSGLTNILFILLFQESVTLTALLAAEDPEVERMPQPFSASSSTTTITTRTTSASALNLVLTLVCCCSLLYTI